VHETKTKTNDTNTTYKQDPVDNHAVLSYTSMDGFEHERITILRNEVLNFPLTLA
jgi:hypothetical protein